MQWPYRNALRKHVGAGQFCGFLESRSLLCAAVSRFRFDGTAHSALGARNPGRVGGSATGQIYMRKWRLHEESLRRAILEINHQREASPPNKKRRLNLCMQQAEIRCDAPRFPQPFFCVKRLGDVTALTTTLLCLDVLLRCWRTLERLHLLGHLLTQQLFLAMNFLQMHDGVQGSGSSTV